MGAKVTGLSDTDEKAASGFLLESFKALRDYNDPVLNPGHLYDTFQEACNLDIPAGEDFRDDGSDDLLIHRSPSLLVQEAIAGENPSSQAFTLFKSGPGSLTYELTTNVDWLSVTPSTGATAGEVDTIT